ncbi:urease accessory protein [Fontibacillus panacisegetis]|uniref:Urease accessory protein UreD n=1 Tax=Fontibacillus panacisegetis TaxID=670482 RepID=A0A1G7U9R4_9BACL|nr:urease accessory protein UreD [Fontibacillus panacisegetis]SDG44174.1 urease accessory protein [Fontibacillus panacisegetis]
MPIIIMPTTSFTRARFDGKSRLRADFRVDQNGKTFIHDRYYTAPLRISRTFRPDGGSGELYLYTTDVSPGVLDGDHYQSEWLLSNGAHVILSSTSAVRLHPTPNHPSVIEQTFHIGKRAILEFFPECVIPFRGSNCTMNTEFHLEQDSILVYADVWSAGRIHYGEAFEFDQYTSLTEVTRENRLIVWDKFALEPGRDLYGGSPAFMSYTHSAALWIVCPQIGNEELGMIREVLRKNSDDKQMIFGASLLAHQGGVAVRMLGTSAERLQQCCLSAWNVLRPSLLQKPALLLRK